jgi:hypothetical protein
MCRGFFVRCMVIVVNSCTRNRASRRRTRKQVVLCFFEMKIFYRIRNVTKVNLTLFRLLV